MADTLEPQAARAARRFTAAANRPIRGLALYHWIFLLICLISAPAIAAPRLLTQPVVYAAQAELRFDLARYGPIYNLVAPETTALAIAFNDTTEALRQANLARGEVRFGLPDYRVEFTPLTPGIIAVRGFAGDPASAQQLANAAADELVRQIRAAGGREIVRNMLGWELFRAMNASGSAAEDPFAALLREVIRTQAFPLSRPIEPVAEPTRFDQLSSEEQRDLARAFEARYDLWRFAIANRDASIDAVCSMTPTMSGSERSAQLQLCRTNLPGVEPLLLERQREVERLRAIDSTIRYLVGEQGLRFDATSESAAFHLGASLPTSPEPNYNLPILLLAAVAGLAVGGLGVLADRSAGLVARFADIWAYRELVRNLVLRDLRSRYKGSTLGYLWTQIAPLLTMLVFVFVFSVLFPSGIAMFPVYIIVGLLAWNYCAESVLIGTRSIIDNGALLKKVYFPREVLPLVSVFSSLINYLLSLPMMFAVMIVVQLLTIGTLNFALTFFYLPVILAIETIFLIGVAFFLSALAVFFRDIVHLIGVLINFWFFLTPVFYSLDLTIGDGLTARIIRWLNPMASIVEFFREILYGGAVGIGQIPTPAVPALGSMLRVTVTALAVLVIGYWFFRKSSGRFGEEL